MSRANTLPEAHCAACPMTRVGMRRCVQEGGQGPLDCPTLSRPEMGKESLGVYKGEPCARMARVAARTERAGYEKAGLGLRPARPRIVELMDFARRMGYKKVALLFCIGLRKEAAVAGEILETNGFEVLSAICKVGCLPKEELGLTKEDQLNSNGDESMCNPVMQAALANEAGVDFNILLGLCVGHDTLALAHLKAPATILAVKDRLLGHNPLAALQQYDTYYSYLKNRLFD
ncbi:MAG: DUF1847 domain-containing protein [Desulfovibrionaceae bacterium]|nr:DUF1847 domain-containing protein [Desulfovibrionaceae bacterium]